MHRSWLVTSAVCFATTVATLHGTRAVPQPVTPPPQEAGVTAGTKPNPSTTSPKGHQGNGGHVQTPGQVSWGEVPPALPRGAQAAVLYGDPAARNGSFTIRLKMPDGYKVMPHTHPTDEFVTVLSGTVRVGMGRTWDDAGMKTLPAGGFAHMPANSAHYVQARGEAVLQVSGQAPFTLTYVNPADDPRKGAPPTSTRR